MRLTHVREADLNLLQPLHALLEERQVTRAASRCGLSQPAMSRAFERLRETFHDELLVRTEGRYERTARGERLLAELQDLLPRLETAIRGDRFDPATSKDRFRIATTDYAGAILLPKLLEDISSVAPRVRLEVVAWNTAERGQRGSWSRRHRDRRRSRRFVSRKRRTFHRPIRLPRFASASAPERATDAAKVSLIRTRGNSCDKWENAPDR